MWPEEGDFPENVHRVVYVIINKWPLESFHVFGSDFITLAVILVSDSLFFMVGKGVREAGWKHEGRVTSQRLL